MSESTKEREILMVMRKVLASIVKDTTPPPGTRHPLSDSTIQDVRACFGLIASREKELAESAGVVEERPYYIDEKPKAAVVSIDSIGTVDKE
ncbi:MAG: segregation and condensation protein A [Candidatus Sedimenticola sp. (ex Thyasira tokunagai)]